MSNRIKLLSIDTDGTEPDMFMLNTLDHVVEAIADINGATAAIEFTQLVTAKSIELEDKY